MAIRLITADAVTLSRLGYVAAVANCPDLELVAQAADVDEAFALVAEHVPDVVAVDVDLPGLELAGELRVRHPRLGILMTGPTRNDLVIKSLEAGLSGYLPRSALVEVLLSAVRHAAVAPASFTSPLLASALARSEHHDVLSPREQQVFELLNSGVSPSSIARELHLNESTVRTYAARIYSKLEVPPGRGHSAGRGTASRRTTWDGQTPDGRSDEPR